MDGAWRRGFDFAVLTGDVGREVHPKNDSPVLDVLYKMHLVVSAYHDILWFNI